MNMQQVKALAKERGVKAGNLNKNSLIQSIQSHEGNEPCYGTGKSTSCGQVTCLWKDDCK